MTPRVSTTTSSSTSTNSPAEATPAHVAAGPPNACVPPCGACSTSPAAASPYTDFAALPAHRRNYLRLVFTHPGVRQLHQDWAHDAREAVAAPRMEAAAAPDDPDLAQLVGELSLQDPDFRTRWAEHRVNSASYGILTAEPGTPSHDALRILTSRGTGRDDHLAGTSRE